jgi:hypothetical protein
MLSMDFNPEKVERYSRQLILPFWNMKKQETLSTLSVFVDTDFSAAALYLAAAGVGKILTPQISGHFFQQINNLNSATILKPYDNDYIDISILSDQKAEPEGILGTIILFEKKNQNGEIEISLKLKKGGTEKIYVPPKVYFIRKTISAELLSVLIAIKDLIDKES